MVTSPRVPPGLLALAGLAGRSADAVLAAAGHPQLPALDEAGIQYQVVGASSIGALAADGTVVWLPEPGAAGGPAVARLLHGSADLPGAGPHGRVDPEMELRAAARRYLEAVRRWEEAAGSS